MRVVISQSSFRGLPKDSLRPETLKDLDLPASR
jgi:hypothetical protein